MWICRDCAAELDSDGAPPESDDIGCYFICPSCDYRNLLLVIRNADGSLTVLQPDLDWPDGTPWRD
jgi:DNA-directed RNA polymerase subunit RPC12/RpoP